MIKKVLTILCVLIAVITFSQCGWGTWRYKMTVVVETPEGIKTGFAVREVKAFTRPALLGEPGKISTTTNVKGEAVVVDLGKRGVLFAVLGINDSHEIVYEAFPSIEGPLTGKGIKYYDGLYKKIGDKKVILKRSMRDYPILVMFTDIEDPKTVKLVHHKKLDEVFGDGVKLKEIYIQMTDEPITQGKMDNYMFRIKSLFFSIARNSNFKKGE